MNVLSGEISCQVRAGAGSLPLECVCAVPPHCTHPPTHPQPCHCEGGRNAFQKVAPFTVKDVGCRPIFHLRLKGGDLQRERTRESRAAKFLAKKNAWMCLGFFFQSKSRYKNQFNRWHCYRELL